MARRNTLTDDPFSSPDLYVSRWLPEGRQCYPHLADADRYRLTPVGAERRLAPASERGARTPGSRGTGTSRRLHVRSACRLGAGALADSRHVGSTDCGVRMGRENPVGLAQLSAWDHSRARVRLVTLSPCVKPLCLNCSTMACRMQVRADLGVQVPLGHAPHFGAFPAVGRVLFCGRCPARDCAPLRCTPLSGVSPP